MAPKKIELTAEQLKVAVNSSIDRLQGFQKHDAPTILIHQEAQLLLNRTTRLLELQKKQ